MRSKEKNGGGRGFLPWKFKKRAREAETGCLDQTEKQASIENLKESTDFSFEEFFMGEETFPFLIVRNSGNQHCNERSHVLFPLTMNSTVCFLPSTGEMEMSQHEFDSKIFLLQWLRELWINGLNSEYQGWDGTLINFDEEEEKVESVDATSDTKAEIRQMKGTYVLCLELFYHLRTMANTSEDNEANFLRNFFEITLSEEMDEVLFEHYSLLGLYFYLRRTMSYDGFQFFGNLSPIIRSDCMSSGDICRDFINGVDGYFGTQIVWKLVGISTQGTIRTLSKKYEELMEIYFRIKCYLSNGLLKCSDEEKSWKSVYHLICVATKTVHSSSQRNRYIAKANLIFPDPQGDEIEDGTSSSG
jgi:hypothetical protein